jgi:ankyrin repeat protein
MQAVNPKLILFLILVVVLAVVLKTMNPHKKYSTREFWQSATTASVDEVPDDALQPGNKNGGVLMWAAMGVSDPAILDALVRRGADINESDPIFSGTPLTGAAGYSEHPEVIEALVQLGADVDMRVNNNEDALMIAAQYNPNPGIIETLVALGSDLDAKNSQGLTALELAKKNHNQAAEDVLARLIADNSNRRQ